MVDLVLTWRMKNFAISITISLTSRSNIMTLILLSLRVDRMFFTLI